MQLKSEGFSSDIIIDRRRWAAIFCGYILSQQEFISQDALYQ
jgi:hypothetical protein